jgi:iron complex outermembrane receptor protein
VALVLVSTGVQADDGEDGDVAAPPTEDSADLRTDIEDVSLEDLLRSSVAVATKTDLRMAETPSVVSVVWKDHIRNYGWLTLNDILYKLPGFQPARDYERRTIGGRGMFEGWNNNHLLLLIDGVPFNDNLYGSVYSWDVTPLFLANRVEILRDPGSPLYGTNATNGVIAIHTPTAETGVMSLEGRSYVSRGETQGHEVMATWGNPQGSYVLGLSYNSTPGNEYLDYDGSGRTQADGVTRERFLVEDERSSHYVFAKLEPKGALQGLSLQLHQQGWSFETGHGWLWNIPNPIRGEDMYESRQLVALSYHPGIRSGLSQEFVLRYQRHFVDWDMEYFGEPSYPSGAREVLRTSGHDLFARAQVQKKLPQEASALAGVEYSGFLYRGDEEHRANFFVLGEDAGAYGPRPGFVAYDSWFEPVENRPVNNIGVYGQLLSGKFLHERLLATAGVRYDIEFFRYDADLEDAEDIQFKYFDKVSPRLGLVYLASEDLSLKALAGRSFRAPAPSELFGANTWTLASNLSALEPETVDMVELAADWNLTHGLTWRSNVYWREFQNQIAYSVANANLSTNLYTQSGVGIETEVLWGVDLPRVGRLSGFANATFLPALLKLGSKEIALRDETIADATIAERDGAVTWAPSYYGNAGAHFRRHDLDVSAQGHYQGLARRRSSDRASLDNRLYRPAKVAAWLTFDARASYRFDILRLGLQVQNLLDTRGYLIKNNDYAFDYQIEGRQIFATLEVDAD